MRHWWKWVRPAEALVAGGVAVIVVTLLYLALEHGDIIPVLVSSDYIGSSLIETLKVAGSAAGLIACVSYAGAFALRFFLQRIGLYFVILLLSQFLISYHVLLLAWRSAWGADGYLGQHWHFFGYGFAGTVAVMVVRYLPISLLLQYLHMQALTPEQLIAARNHLVPAWRWHFSIVLPWSTPVTSMIAIFAFFLCALDPLAPAVAGGGKQQTIGILIAATDTTHALIHLKMAIGFLTIAAIIAMIWIAHRAAMTRVALSVTPTRCTSERPRTSLAHLIMLSFPIWGIAALLVIALGSVIWFGVSPPAPPASPASEIGLYHSLRRGLVLSGIVATICVALSITSVIARHQREQDRRVGAGHPDSGDVMHARFALVDALFLTPLVLPSSVLGIASSGVQGILGIYGSALSVGTLHCFSFVPLSFFVLAACLVQFPAYSLKASDNHQIARWRYWTLIFGLRAWKYVVLAWFLVFCLSLNDAVLARYVGGDFETFAMAVATSQVSELTGTHYRLICYLFLGSFGIYSCFAVAVWLRRRLTNTMVGE